MNKKIVLSVLMLLSAIACIALGIDLFYRSFAESTSLFMSATETMRESNEIYQRFSMIAVGLGVLIVVFLRKYWK